MSIQNSSETSNQINTQSQSINIRDLSCFALFSLIFGSMMGSGVFDIPQNVAHKAGAVAVIVSWVITAIGMLSLGWVFIYITAKRPDIKSGIYGYAKYGFGDYVGFNSAWGYWLNALLGNASYLIYIFATLGNFAMFKIFGKGNTTSALIGESILIWLVYILICRGIKGASIVNISITAIKILALITVLLFFFYGFDWSQFKVNLSTVDLSLGSMLTQIKSTMLVTVWDFLGIEAACIYAVRAKDMKDVARATMLGVSAVFIIDALLSILPFGIMASTQISQLSTPPSTANVLTVITGVTGAASFIPIIIRVAVIISVVGALLAWSLLATNIFYLAAVDKTLPRALAQINGRAVPSRALLISMITLQIFIIAAHLTESVYLVMIQLATSLALIPYLLSAMFAFKLIITEGKIAWFSWLKGIVAMGYGVWLIYAGGLKYLAFASTLSVFGIIFYAIARREQQQKLFSNTFEKLLAIIIVIIALFSSYFWYKGLVSF
jgi:arginine:ornithine antiporter/lysine permease